MSDLTKGEQTKQRILKETRYLLTTNGFYNTSLNDIIRNTGVKKGNLYYYFPSKEDLCLAVLEDARDEFFAILEKSFVGATPLDRIHNFCQALLKEQKNKNFVGGCLFGNAALEMSDCNARFSKVLNDVFSTWLDHVQSHISQAQSAGTLATNLPPRMLAKLLVASLEGGIMMARVSKDERDLEDCILSINELLGRK